MMNPSQSKQAQDVKTCDGQRTESINKAAAKSRCGESEGRKRNCGSDSPGPGQKKSLLVTEDIICVSDASSSSGGVREVADEDDCTLHDDSENKEKQKTKSVPCNPAAMNENCASCGSSSLEKEPTSVSEVNNSETLNMAKCDGETTSGCDGPQASRKCEQESSAELSRHERRQLNKMGYRPFVNTPFGEAVKQMCSANGVDCYEKKWLRFRVASYNVLSQDLLVANDYLYRSVRPSALDWEYRKSRLIRDILYADADIICLQEVHHEHYETFFKKQLEMKGYQGHYIKRTGSQNDGCASFFRTSVFNLDKAVSVPYYRENVDVLDRHNIALLLLLSSRRQPDRKLCVTNTHLLFNPRRDDVRFAQLMILLAEIDRLAYHSTDINGRPLYHPIIMCGDFNSEPHCDLYQLIRRGSLKYRCPVAGSWDKKLLDSSVGITDQCQYIADVYWRFIKYATEWRNVCNQVIPCMQNANGAEITKGDIPTTENPNKTTNTPYVMPSTVKVDPAVIPDALPVFLSDISLSMSSSSSDLPFTNDKSVASLVYNPVSNLTKVMRPLSFQFSFGSGSLQHQFSFDSVYTHGSRRNAEVTTSHARANCTVDYIFFTKHQVHGEGASLEVKPGEIRLLNRMKLLTEEEVLRLGGLPNAVMSSDHFLICGTFLLGV